MNRKDLILIVLLLSAAGAAAVFLFLRKGAVSAPQPTAVARVDGEVIGVWPLGTQQEVDLDTDYGHNHLSLKDGAAQITEADCPDHICVYQGSVSAPGDLIVCLPHHLIVEIAGGEESS